MGLSFSLHVFHWSVDHGKGKITTALYAHYEGGFSFSRQATICYLHFTFCFREISMWIGGWYDYCSLEIVASLFFFSPSSFILSQMHQECLLSWLLFASFLSSFLPSFSLRGKRGRERKGRGVANLLHLFTGVIFSSFFALALCGDKVHFNNQPSGFNISLMSCSWTPCIHLFLVCLF